MDFLNDMSKVEFKRNKELNKYKKDLLKGKYLSYLSDFILYSLAIYGVVSIIIDVIKLF